MDLKIKKLHPDAKIPKFALMGDAGMDLYALKKHIVKPKEIVKISTGIAMEIPHGYVGLIWDKGSISMIHGLKSLGGVFDSGYRGDFTVALVNLGNKEFVFEKGDKIAQILIQKIEQPNIKIVEELSTSERGEERWGSTGRK